VPQVEVTFDIDANGILHVKAKDKATGKEQSIVITGSSGLSKEEIERMTKEAESHAAEDRQKKELIETRNLADTLIYTTEKALRDAGDKVPAADRSDIEAKIEELKKVNGGDNLNEIKTKTQALSQAAQKIGAAMYGSGQPGQPAGDQPSADGQDNVVEGEVEDGGKDKKDEPKK